MNCIHEIPLSTPCLRCDIGLGTIEEETMQTETELKTQEKLEHIHAELQSLVREAASVSQGNGQATFVLSALVQAANRVDEILNAR